MRIEEGFRQEEPKLAHPFLDDPVLPGLVKRLFPDDRVDDVTRELKRFGDEINGYIRRQGTRTYPPTLTQYDHFSRRIDDLQTSEGWRALKAVAAKEGIVAIGYEFGGGELARVLMLMKTYMWTAESRTVGCPMAMTDGAAYVLQASGTNHMRRFLLPRLLSRDPKLAYTAGQWMTERPGGSDVSHTETIARPIGNLGLESGAPYELSGVKWFSSATDGQLALALAQVVGPTPAPTNPALLAPTSGKHSLGLGLFVVPLPGADLSLFTPNHDELVVQPRNGIGIHRLKNKIGTHALPTAELTLEGTVGFLLLPSPVNPKGLETGTGVVKPNGIRAIAPVLNITRIHSATASVGHLARCLAIAEAYTHVRRVAAPRVGKEKREQVLLADVPLHTATLARVELVRRALTHFLFGVVRLLGRVETGKCICGGARCRWNGRVHGRARRTWVHGGNGNRQVRALQYICVIDRVVLGLSENGYRLIRDSLVEKIWEGTTNVLALDMMKVAQEHSGTSVRALCEVSRPFTAPEAPSGISISRDSRAVFG
ncbi:hypothetical protein FRC12_009833 [Ceratobasidium sp. 428]|nr:hypothetical protein FRC12_009833 [Ceratobasidium sp. 428]